MDLTKWVPIDGKEYALILSDDPGALLEAKAAGRAVLGLEAGRKEGCGWLPASYVAESPEEVTAELAERVVRRHLGLPWTICGTERLLIRELQAEDDVSGLQAVGAAASFPLFGEDALDAYIKNQYGFYEYGIWAVTEKESGRLIGEAGLSGLEPDSEENALELGYHIRPAFRRQGYAKEACMAVMDYAARQLGVRVLYARIAPYNRASLCLAKALGFKEAGTSTGSAKHSGLYAVYLT